MANEEHLARLKQGVEVWNAWRRENRDILSYGGFWVMRPIRRRCVLASG
jgi:hypothetical protein